MFRGKPIEAENNATLLRSFPGASGLDWLRAAAGRACQPDCTNSRKSRLWRSVQRICASDGTVAGQTSPSFRQDRDHVQASSGQTRLNNGATPPKDVCAVPLTTSRFSDPLPRQVTAKRSGPALINFSPSFYRSIGRSVRAHEGFCVNEEHYSILGCTKPSRWSGESRRAAAIALAPSDCAPGVGGPGRSGSGRVPDHRSYRYPYAVP